MSIVPTRITGIIGAVRGAIRFAGVMPPIGIVPVGIIGIKARRYDKRQHRPEDSPTFLVDY